MTTMEPGWYPEPGDPSLTRYWDGRQWTPETRRNFAQSPQRAAEGSVSAAGLIVVAVGATAIVVAYTALNWFDLGSDDSGVYKTRFSFGDLADDDTLPGFAAAYFAWLGWVILAAVVALAVAACLPSPNRDIFRYLGFTAGVGGVAATLGALVTLGRRLNGSASDFVAAFGPGPWITMIAFLVVGLGAMMGELGQQSQQG